MKEIIILLVGCWIGFVCGLGSSFGRIEKLALEKPKIEGNVTIHGYGKPVTISGFQIDMTNTQGKPAITLSNK